MAAGSGSGNETSYLYTRPSSRRVAVPILKLEAGMGLATSDHRYSNRIVLYTLVWPATTVFLNASGVKDGLAPLEINCATFDESATSADNLGTH